ncbi:MAG: DUF2470 domain-containing protein [Bdellovibrionota bacterium]|nr:DUF2470 domain-containing protein [Bdellovibrionota bacterium]
MSEKLTDMKEVSHIARSFMKGWDTGVLSTQFTKEENDYPLGSVTPFVMTEEGDIVILISDIAIHTRNIKANPKVGFTVFDMESSHKQASSRVMLIGDAEVVKEGAEDYTSVSEKYFTFFPMARNYFKAHGFDFWKIKPNHIHFIQGFGKIYTFEAEKGWRQDPPAWKGEEMGAITHMNEDHKDTLHSFGEKLLEKKAEEVSLISVDREGFHMKLDNSIHYLNFLSDAGDASGLHREFVSLAKSVK